MQRINSKTAVFSGVVKSTANELSLRYLCVNWLQQNLNSIICVPKELPYQLLKPVLKKCSVEQLRQIERNNPQLLAETDELWSEFVQKKFKTPLKPEQFDSWRQYYDFQVAEQESRLKVIIAGISSKARKAVPERKTVTIDVKLPREIRRRQERASSSGRKNTQQRRKKQTKKKTTPLMKRLLKIRNL